MKIDFKDSFAVTISSQDTNDLDFDIDGYKITFVIDKGVAATEVAAYDPSSSTSPPAADSRVYARLILDALKKILES